jgi:hypothetical protein
MSVSSISSSDVSPYQGAQSSPSNFQKIQKEFQQLGQDLQSGNLSQAQADFATLQSTAQAVASSNAQSAASTSKPATSGNLATDFNKLSQDLRSGNLSAAQGDFATIQQDVQQQSSRSAAGHHHHHSEDSSSSQNSPAQLFSQLGQALQSGNLSNAQSAYASLQQEFAQSGAAATTPPLNSSTSSSSGNSLNVSA